MKAARLHDYGAPLRVEEVDDPRIEGPLDVIVRVGAAGLCRTDIHIRDAEWQPVQEEAGLDLPYIPGHENAGWVEEVGSGVTNVRPGDAVILHPLMTCGLCRACRAGNDMHCERSAFPGLDADGGFAQLMRTGARCCIKLADGLEPVDVAPLADAGLTAYHAVRKAVPLLHPGSSVVVVGAGGLGHIAIQCLRALTPARIVAVDVGEAALRLAGELGADHTIAADGSEADRVREVTSGRGAEVVIDFVAEKGIEKRAPDMVANGGSYLVVGYGGALDLPTHTIIFREINVIGNLVGTYNELVDLLALATDGKVAVRTTTYPLDDVNDAMNDLDAGRLQGRGILVP